MNVVHWVMIVFVKGGRYVKVQGNCKRKLCKERERECVCVRL